MMRHSQNHQTVFTTLVDEAVWELGKHESAGTLRDLRSSVRILTNTGEPGVDLVREDQPQTRALALVVVDGVVELATAFRGGLATRASLQTGPSLGDDLISGDCLNKTGIDLGAATQRFFDPELLDLSLG